MLTRGSNTSTQKSEDGGALNWRPACYAEQVPWNSVHHGYTEEPRVEVPKIKELKGF